MLGLRPMSWKAVGLTAAVGRLALRGSTRRCQGGSGKRASRTMPFTGGEGSRCCTKMGTSTCVKKREPFPEYPKETKGVGFSTGKTRSGTGEKSTQDWEAPTPHHPREGDDGTTKGRKECPNRIWSLCEKGPGSGHGRPRRNGRTQPALRNGSVEQEDVRVRVEDIHDLDKIGGVWLALRVRGGTDGEGPGKSAHPVKPEKPEEGKAGKEPDPPGKDPPRNPGKSDPPPGGEGGEPGHEDKIGLKYTPVCCSCNKQGVEKLQHTGEIDTWPTFAKRPIRKGSKTLLGICLMRAHNGLIQGDQGKLCGHTPCMQCTRKKQEQMMCLCCAARLEVLGAGKGGAGPLPKPERRRSPSRTRSRTPPPRQEHTMPPPGEGYCSSESDSDRRSARWGPGGRRPSPRSPPGHGKPDRSRPDPEGGMAEDDERPEFHKCAIRGCKRPGRAPGATCCDPCAQTGGQKHSRACNNQFGPVPPPNERDRDDDEDEEDDDDDKGDHYRKGKGRGKGKAKKSEAKALRDRDRWRSWDWNKRGIRRVWNPARFAKALTMGRAASTLKCTESRLCTWDRVMKTLEDKEMIPRETLPGIITAERITAGVACLKSQGYRSAELYMSAALLRHRARYGQSAEITMASRDATRLARRGRGPPAGKQPVPIPKPNAPHFEAMATGIWYLLRVGELVALNVEDVLKKRSGGKLLVALHVRNSKTDQEQQGELVARECTCGEDPDDMCPAHLLWDQVTDRKVALCKIGGVTGKTPLFVGNDGCRITSKEILEAVTFTAKEAGEKIVDKEGRARYGTHSMRVAGALAAFCAGVDEPTIRALGRWKSTQAMMMYLRGTPLVKASKATKVMSQAMIPGPKEGEVNFRPIFAEGFGQGIERAPFSREGLDKVLMIRHGITGALHRMGKAEGDPERWTTWCGWRWARCGLAGTFPNWKEEALCKRCFG